MEKEITTTDIVNYVNSSVLQHNGKGFTIKVLPEITKNITYEGHVPLFGKYTYRPILLDSGGYSHLKKCRRKVNSLSPADQADWNVVISKEVSKSYNKLPLGIAINKTPKSTLLDERDTSHDHNGHIHYADYAEGRRVTISVSDEYAARIFKEVYTDVGFPFRDLLLTKHGNILNNVATTLHNSIYFSNENFTKYGVSFFVDDSHVGTSVGTTNHKEPETSIAFIEYNMKPLVSWGQKFGMALAIIEALKNKHPRYRNAIVTMNRYDFFKSINVQFRTPSKPIVESSPELNDW